MKAFMTIKNNPALMKINGNDKSFRIGLTSMFKIVMVAPAITGAIQLPSKLRPGSTKLAINSARALTKIT